MVVWFIEFYKAEVARTPLIQNFCNMEVTPLSFILNNSFKPYNIQSKATPGRKFVNARSQSDHSFSHQHTEDSEMQRAERGCQGIELSHKRDGTRHFDRGSIGTTGWSGE